MASLARLSGAWFSAIDQLGPASRGFRLLRRAPIADRLAGL
jgi:hypothetical protein